MTDFDNTVYDDKARADILALKRQFPDKIFALAPFELETVRGFHRIKIAVLGANSFAADPSDSIFSCSADARNWARKIAGVLGHDQETAAAIIADVARREMRANDEEPVAELKLTLAEIQTLIQIGFNSGYEPDGTEESDPDLKGSMLKLSSALEEMTCRIQVQQR